MGVKSILRSYDQYGKTFTLTCDGEDTIKTVYGGVITLAGKFLICVLIFNKIRELYGKDYDLISYQEFQDLEHLSWFNIPLEEFEFKFQFFEYSQGPNVTQKLYN
jgi:hypothetical protein